MKLFPPDPPVELYIEGFGKDDPLNRVATGKSLSSLVDKIEEPVVIAIDGDWGMGKTYFLKRWVGAHKLENGGRATTIYFDAFAHDFLEDPLIAITSAISERLPDAGKNKAWQKVKSATAMLARPATRIALAMATYGATEFVGTAADVVLQSSAAEVKKATEEFWRREDGRREAMQQLKTALQSMTNSGTAGKGESTPLVIVVDELDRCRPDYALAVLETIKHFFAVPNIHFVLGVNIEALQSSVRARYGAEIDGEEYLRRFITLTLRLNESTGRNEDRPVQVEYFERAAEQMGIPKKTQEVFARHLKMRLRSHKISIRDVGQILTQIALMHGDPSFEKLRWGWQDLIASLVLYKVLCPKLYRLAIDRKISQEDVREFYGITDEHFLTNERGRAETYDHPSYIVDGIWGIITSEKNADFPDRDQFANALDEFGDVGRFGSLARRASRDFLERFSVYGNERTGEVESH
ncbi:MAG: P-loop NTPase fold protein [Albidovulum sp.]